MRYRFGRRQGLGRGLSGERNARRKFLSGGQPDLHRAHDGPPRGQGGDGLQRRDLPGRPATVLEDRRQPQGLLGNDDGRRQPHDDPTAEHPAAVGPSHEKHDDGPESRPVPVHALGNHDGLDHEPIWAEIREEGRRGEGRQMEGRPLRVPRVGGELRRLWTVPKEDLNLTGQDLWALRALSGYVARFGGNRSDFYDFDGSALGFTGIPVKAEVVRAGKTLVVEMKKAKKKNLDPSLFEIPSGYQKKLLPSI